MSHCCLCGLLCWLDHSAAAAGIDAAAASCPRREQWLSQVSDAHAGRLRQGGWQGKSNEERLLIGGAISDAAEEGHLIGEATSDSGGDVAAMSRLFVGGRRTLIWVDGADVQTMRAAVALARAAKCTIHVGQSTATQVAHRILTSQGWLGTSLAEVASHADLIVTLGGGLRSEAPRLIERFIAPAQSERGAQWYEISDRAGSQPGVPVGQDCARASQTQQASQQPTQIIAWPRESWYQKLTEVLWGLQAGSPGAKLPQPALADDVRGFVARLQQAKLTTWLWDVEEFCDDVDELTLQRLLGISRCLSQTARCSLLALDANVGRVTAQETLLWLTGFSDTVRFDGQRWFHPSGLHCQQLHDWESRFDSIVVVRSLPSLAPLPNLSAQHYLVPSGSQLPNQVSKQSITAVAAVSVDSAGHVARGDRALFVHCQPDTHPPAAAESNAPKQLQTAAQWLQRVHAQILQEDGQYAN